MDYHKREHHFVSSMKMDLEQMMKDLDDIGEEEEKIVQVTTDLMLRNFLKSRSIL
jgi:hypothetical protein